MKNFIESECFTKKGSFNNRVTIDTWWSNKNFVKEKEDIIEATNFLNEDSSLTQRCYHIYHEIYNRIKCKNEKCNNYTNFKNFKEGYFNYCSRFCSTQCEKRNKSIKEKINYDEVQKKIVKQNLEKYGVEYSFQRKDIVDKIKKTKLEKYGNENYCNIEKVKAKNLEKYGAEHYFQSDEWKRKREEYLSQNAGSIRLEKEIAEKVNDLEYLKHLNEDEEMCLSEIAIFLRVNPRTILLRHPNHQWKKYPIRYGKLQYEIYEELKRNNIECVFNDNKAIYPKEIDIYIPSRKLGIELNGLYWHSYDRVETFEEKRKHIDKRELCESKNIELIQFTDREYLSNKSLIYSILFSKLGLNQEKIRASKCEVTVINKEQEKKFLEENHIQGYIPSKICYGLVYKDEVVSLMSFGIPRFNKNYDYELLRLCTKKNYKVYGGMNKLFKKFIRNNENCSVISYCDLDKFSGKVYNALGFEFLRRTNPSYFYHNRNQILSRYQCQKKNLSKILENYEDSLSESENMFSHGFMRYWNCGNDVYVYGR